VRAPVLFASPRSVEPPRAASLSETEAVVPDQTRRTGVHFFLNCSTFPCLRACEYDILQSTNGRFPALVAEIAVMVQFYPGKKDVLRFYAACWLVPRFASCAGVWRIRRPTGGFDAEAQGCTPCGIVCDCQPDSCGDRAVIIAPAH